MHTVTVHDKILSHLYRFRYVRYDVKHNAPYELTQIGIGSALGVSRPRISIMLKKMEESGEVLSHQANVNVSGRNPHRLIYTLSEHGKNEYQSRVEELRSAGIQLDNIKLNASDYNLNSIEDVDVKQRETLGFLCVKRKRMKRADVECKSALIHTNNAGDVFIKDDSKQKILSSCSADDLRRWHSAAADWYIDHDNDRNELLYHLTNAGRDREAIRIVKSGT